MTLIWLLTSVGVKGMAAVPSGVGLCFSGLTEVVFMVFGLLGAGASLVCESGKGGVVTEARCCFFFPGLERPGRSFFASTVFSSLVSELQAAATKHMHKHNTNTQARDATWYPLMREELA